MKLKTALRNFTGVSNYRANINIHITIIRPEYHRSIFFWMFVLLLKEKHCIYLHIDQSPLKSVESRCSLTAQVFQTLICSAKQSLKMNFTCNISGH